MGVLKRVEKTKTQKGKRALEEREAKAIENTKTAIFVRGTNCSDLVMKCMKGENENISMRLKIDTIKSLYVNLTH